MKPLHNEGADVPKIDNELIAENQRLQNRVDELECEYKDLKNSIAHHFQILIARNYNNIGTSSITYQRNAKRDCIKK